MEGIRGMAMNLGTAHPVAKKKHRCESCGGAIQPGDRYVRARVEDPAEAAPLVRSHNNRLVPILFGIAVAAILLGGGSDSPCNAPDEPTPEPGGCP